VWVKKSISLKIFAIFSLRLSTFWWNFFCRFIASLYPHILTNFGRFISIFNTMLLIFLRVLIIFTVKSFEFQQVKLPWLHCHWWVVPNLPDLSPLTYHVWGQCWSIITSCNLRQKQLPSLKMHFSRFGLPYERKPLTELWKTTASD